MRVNNQNVQGNIAKPDSAQTKKAESAAKAGESVRIRSPKAELATEKRDVGDASTEISSKAKEMAQAKSVAMDAPDVREAKIAELKKRIANKEYNVKPEDIADKMVHEHIQTRGLS